MLVVIRVMVFTILQYRNYFRCQAAVKAHSTGITMVREKLQHRSTKFPTIEMEKTRRVLIERLSSGYVCMYGHCI